MNHLPERMSDPAPRHRQHQPQGSCSTLCPSLREADPQSSRSPRVHSPPMLSSCLPTHTPQYLTHSLFNSPSALLATPFSISHPNPPSTPLSPPCTGTPLPPPQWLPPVYQKVATRSAARPHRKPPTAVRQTTTTGLSMASVRQIVQFHHTEVELPLQPPTSQCCTTRGPPSQPFCACMAVYR